MPTFTPSPAATASITVTMETTGTVEAILTPDLTVSPTAEISGTDTVAPFATPLITGTITPEAVVTGTAESSVTVTPDANVTVDPTVTPSAIPVIVIDPGHGGSETGAVAASGLKEKDVNLTIALMVAAQLREIGYRVVLTRDSDRQLNDPKTDVNGDGTIDTDDDLQSRVDVARREGATLFLSIHNNADTRSTKVRGTTTYYCAERTFGADSQHFAELLQARLVDQIRAIGYDTADRGARDDTELGKPEGHLYLLGPKNSRISRPSTMTGAIGETLFLSNPEDAAQLARPEMLAAIASGYMLGVEDYLSGK